MSPAATASNYQQRCQSIHWGKKKDIIKYCSENWISTCRILKDDPYFSSFTKINTKWMKDCNVRHETLKRLE
jgi:hypothetical protein